ncbi:hypothetical protein [Microbacterium sp. 179-I 3D4 NHS]|uniref:hypothetical protein n=1 Tax=Microbacterium sp. 179-I 3D4 NHS TaxID=3142381 RepID=UPI0039A3CA70
MSDMSDAPRMVPPYLNTEDDAGGPTTEIDGEQGLDPDADDAQIDSAEADRLAAEEGTADGDV